jgi:hypothetical protein
MTNAVKVLLQMQSGFLQLESTIYDYTTPNTTYGYDIFCLSPETTASNLAKCMTT